MSERPNSLSPVENSDLLISSDSASTRLGAIPLRRVVSTGTARCLARQSAGVSQTRRNSVPCRVWACPDHRRTAQEGARSDRHKGGGTASTGGLSGARQAVRSGRGRERIQAPVDQGEHGQAISSSLASGHTTASVALKRLVACSAKNRFYRANRDLGRVFKTEFLLSYLSEPQLRARIRRGLLKVEQLHALARDVYYGRRGRINARELHEQMNSCSCLTLILACIIYWQAKQITQTVPSGAVAEEGIDATPAPARQPDRMGQRHSLRPVRPRSRPGPLATDSYVVFLQQSGRYPITEHNVSCSDTDRQPAYSRSGSPSAGNS